VPEPPITPTANRMATREVKLTSYKGSRSLLRKSDLSTLPQICVRWVSFLFWVHQTLLQVLATQNFTISETVLHVAKHQVSCTDRGMFQLVQSRPPTNYGSVVS